MLIPLISVVLGLAHAPQTGFPKLEDVVIYEANIRAFGPKSNFNAVTDRLGAIQKLGANVLWLMPVQPVGKLRSAGGLGSPYAFADFDKVNPEFGTAADLTKLIREAHRRKMKVILDWVANHTAWDHPWIKAHPDWYRHDAKGAIIIPPGTNWQDVASLDYSNQAMRKTMIASMEGWLDRFDIDGFRCDSVDFVPFNFWKEAVPTLRRHASKPILMLAEGFRSDHYTAGFDLTYGWNFYSKLVAAYKGGKATDLAASDAFERKDIPVGARRLRFSSNHDESAWQGSPLEFFKSANGVNGAFLIGSLYGGTPLIYDGQEVAWPKRIPIFEKSSIDWNSNSVEQKWMASVFALRQNHPALRSGKAEDFSTEDVVAFRRTFGKDGVIVVVNVRNHASTVSIPDFVSGTWHLALGSLDLPALSKITLPGYGFEVLVR